MLSFPVAHFSKWGKAGLEFQDMEMFPSLGFPELSLRKRRSSGFQVALISPLLCWFKIQQFLSPNSGSVCIHSFIQSVNHPTNIY
jgi:hypothetical protein